MNTLGEVRQQWHKTTDKLRIRLNEVVFPHLPLALAQLVLATGLILTYAQFSVSSIGAESPLPAAPFGLATTPTRILPTPTSTPTFQSVSATPGVPVGETNLPDDLPKKVGLIALIIAILGPIIVIWHGVSRTKMPTDEESFDGAKEIEYSPAYVKALSENLATYSPPPCVDFTDRENIERLRKKVDGQGTTLAANSKRLDWLDEEIGQHEIRLDMNDEEHGGFNDQIKEYERRRAEGLEYARKSLERHKHNRHS